MRIAQVSPLYESVPPLLYGGTERVVSYLTEELVRQGHDVSLFASGGSVTNARLRAMTPTGLRLDSRCGDTVAPHVYLLEQVFKEADSFDIVHFHIAHMHFPTVRRQQIPHLTTLHGRLDLPELTPLYDEYLEMPLVSISDVQRVPLPESNWVATVYHGLPLDLHRFEPQPGKYLAYLGRISPEKQPDQAIAIAQRAGMPLKIAAKVDKLDEEYFYARIKPLMKSGGVEFIGEIGDDKKGEFLGNALALLFPIAWPEPFGLVLIEALACGTPVIAYRCGSVPEVLDHGKTGFIVDTIEEAVAAVKRVGELDRHLCRRTFEERFSATRMAQDYIAAYDNVLARSPRRPRPRLALSPNA